MVYKLNLDGDDRIRRHYVFYAHIKYLLDVGMVLLNVENANMYETKNVNCMIEQILAEERVKEC